MFTFNEWKPSKLVKRGDQLISAAVHLLESYGAELSESRRNQAQSLLEYANDFKYTLNNKHPLAQIKPARLYARRANEALEKIKAMPGLQAPMPEIYTCRLAGRPATLPLISDARIDALRS